VALRAALFAGLILAAAPAGALGASAPAITSVPVIGGTPQEGQVLTAEATWTGEPAPTVRWAWMRCDPTVSSCTEIPQATLRDYRLAAADVGSVLRVRLTADSAAGYAERHSDPTTTVTASPTPVAPTRPNGLQTYAETPATFDGAGAATPPAAAPVEPAAPLPAASPPPLLAPFPVVRLRGRLTQTGVRVTLFTVTGPPSVRITAICSGPGCPVRTLARAAAPARLRPFERALRSGIRLEITVTRPGYVGKSTVVVIRRGRAPSRHDACLFPGQTQAVACPAP
jgi:hypothetical protein